MEMNVQKIMGDASTAINRVIQMTSEKMGYAERTEFDAHLENLIARVEKYENSIIKLLTATESYVQPNPAYRAEDFVATHLTDQLKRKRQPNAEYLAQAMLSLGNDLGQANQLGCTLLKCGQAQIAIGESEQEFQEQAFNTIIRPLRQYLDEELKTLHRERKTLENRRLDLDACKTRLKKATSEPAKIALENELRVAQADFNMQIERTKILLDNISNAQGSHEVCVQEFIKVQAAYYERCHLEMQNLLRQTNAGLNSSSFLSVVFNANGDQTAK